METPTPTIKEQEREVQGLTPNNSDQSQSVQLSNQVEGCQSQQKGQREEESELKDEKQNVEDDEDSDREQLPESIIQYYQPYVNQIPKKIVEVDGSKFEIDQNYNIINLMGQGAYGIVAAATYKSQKKIVAIKKIEKVFEHRILCKRALRELKLLRLLQHENIIGIKHIMLPESREKFQNVYLVQEAMEMDLCEIIRSKELEISYEEIEWFTYQILNALKFMHGSNIVHRDLKPKNILINRHCDLKVADFGLARVLHEGNKKVEDLTQYVQTRWYRAPELLLGSQIYTPKIDVWSVGLIFAEMFLRKPLVMGTTQRDQLIRIFKIIGTPDEQDLKSLKLNPEKFYKEFPKFPKQSMRDILKNSNAPEKAIDLISQMLVFDPAKRISVEDALRHPCMQEYYMAEDEKPVQPINPLEFEFEYFDQTITSQQFKDMIYEEILLYHFPEFRQQYLDNLQNGRSVTAHILKNDNRHKKYKDQ